MIGPGLQSEKWRWSGLIDLAEGSGILAVSAFHPLKLAQTKVSQMLPAKGHRVSYNMYRPEVDGLRAIAVASVIINHFDKTLLPNGHLGVDIFFVISGFVITQSLANHQQRSFWSFILDFYTRRAKRLFPVLILCVGVTSLFVLLFFNPKSHLSVSSLKTGIASLFGLSNLYLFRQATDYFGSSAELNPFTHMWFLGVEEQFYLVFPSIIWFSWFARTNTVGIRNFTWVILVTGIFSLTSYYWVSNLNPIAAFYLMPTRFWELAAGSLAYLVIKRCEKRGNSYDLAVRFTSILTSGLLLVILFLPQSYQDVVIIAVVSLTTILIVILRPGFLIYKLLTVRPVVFLGLISYSLYLWHWSVLAINHWTVGVHWWSIPSQAATILLLATISYLFVEKPLRHAEWNILRIGNLRVGAIGHAAFGALSFSGLILSLVILFPGGLYLGSVAPLIKKGTSSIQDCQDYRGMYSWMGSECILASNDDVGKIIVPDNCTFGDFESTERRFLVIGNSVSAAEVEMYKVIVDEKLGSVTITSCWGASAVPEIPNTGRWNKANNYYWSSVVPSLINNLRKGDIVLMINDGAIFSPKNRNRVSEQRLTELRRGLWRMSEKLSKKDISIIYQSGYPFMREANCTPDSAMPQWWHFSSDPPCIYYTRKESLERRCEYNELLLELQRKRPNFFVLDLFDVFCPGEVCKFYDEEGRFLYRDEWSHPSVEACILAQPALLETVKKVISPMSHKFRLQ